MAIPQRPDRSHPLGKAPLYLGDYPRLIPLLEQGDYQRVSGMRLRNLIDVLGITKTEAARIMGVSKHVLRNWLCGENPIGSYGLYRFCKAYGLDFNYVFLGEEERLPPEIAQELDQALEAVIQATPAMTSGSGQLVSENASDD